MVYADGAYFTVLTDRSGSLEKSELRVSPTWVSVPLTYDANALVVAQVYPSITAGNAALFVTELNPVSSRIQYHFGIFPTAIPTTTAPMIPKFADISSAEAFEPFRGSHKNGLLAMASADQDRLGVHMSSFALNGTVRDFNVEVAKISQGEITRASAATLSGLWSAVVWSEEAADADGGIETTIKSQIMLCN